VVSLGRSTQHQLTTLPYLIFKENDDQTIQTAQLFPVFHATEHVGLTEILWLQGEVKGNNNYDILRRYSFI